MKNFRIDDPRFGYLVARALIFSKIKKNLGFDRCKLFLTGAAPLSSDIKSYFASLDIPIMDVSSNLHQYESQSSKILNLL